MNNYSQLIENCRKGDTRSQLAFFREFGEVALKIAWRYVKNEDDAREVMQLCMIKIFQNLDKYKGEASLKTWVSRIAINQSIDFLRQHNNVVLKVDISEIGAIEEEDILVDTDHEIDVYVALNLIKTLPEIYRLVFNLYAIDGLTHAQISTILTITETNSRTILRRGRIMLKQLLDKTTGVNNHGTKTAY